MDFDASILVSGFDISQILSDSKHYSEFICGHCKKLVSLDSVVCEPCSHAFCRKCLETIATECFMKQVACECPVCSANLTGSSMQFGAIRVAARPLREAQPIAYKVLSLVQVQCHNNASQQCNWRGDYGDFLQHVISHSAAAEKKDSGSMSQTNTCALTTSPGRANTSIETATTIEKETTKVDEQRDSPGIVAKQTKFGPYPKPTYSPQPDCPDTNSGNGPSGEQQAEWNSSIGSLDFWAEADSEDQPNLDDDYGDEGSSHNSQEDGDSVERDQTVRKAEKFKKQANAKFNKGDFGAAQKFYTDGIKAMAKIKLQLDEDFHLLSDMHSNRAVTYFREKEFHRCIEDCEVAIDCEPTLEKSWIRKWRGLMALGDMENAVSFLEEASREIPDSKKIRTALRKCSKEMGVFREAQKCMEQAEIPKAKDLLNGCIVEDECDNIVLLTFSARLDMTLGETDVALEKLNKVLRLNPEYSDALELRGYSYFLAGNTEEGVLLLQEAYSRHGDSNQIKAALDRMQKTHTAYSQAHTAMNRGLFPEAIEHFTTAIQESEPLPPLSRLFATLRTERAETYCKTMQFVCALKDCQEVIAVSREYAPAWVVRSDILIALGKAEDARKELAKARRSWGGGNPTIEEGYQKVDFEVRVMKVNDDLEAFEEELANGTCDRLPAAAERARRRGSNLSTFKHQSMRNLKNPDNSKYAMSMSIIDTAGMGLDGPKASPPLRATKRSTSFSDDSHQNQREKRRGSRRNSLGNSSVDSGDRKRKEERRASRRSSLSTSDHRELEHSRVGRQSSREGRLGGGTNERRSSDTGDRRSSGTSRRTSDAPKKKRPDNK